MLQNQLAKGSNGLSKRKYLTFGVESENYRTAKPRLERIETDLLNHFKRLGVAAAQRFQSGRKMGAPRKEPCRVCNPPEIRNEGARHLGFSDAVPRD